VFVEEQMTNLSNRYHKVTVVIVHAVFVFFNTT